MLNLSAAGSHDCPCHAAAVRQLIVGCVDDGIDRLLGEVALHHSNDRAAREPSFV
jgi:hypothetical protein